MSEIMPELPAEFENIGFEKQPTDGYFPTPEQLEASYRSQALQIVVANNTKDLSTYEFLLAADEIVRYIKEGTYTTKALTTE